MRYVLTIALNDLRISARERASFLIGLLMPVLMMLLLGVAMGGSAAESTIYIDVIDEDDSPLSERFVELLRQAMEDEDEAFVICPYTGGAPDGCNLPDDITDDTATDRLEKTDSYGLLTIPPGFGESLRAGDQVLVEYKNSNELSAPTLAEQKLEAVVSQMGGSVAIANLTVRVAGEELDAFEPGSEERKAAFDMALANAENAWSERPILVSDKGTKEKPPTFGFNQSGPGIATMFVFIFMLNASSVLVYEREQGTLQRLYTLPIGKWQIIGGKLLGRYIFGLLQFAILIGIGALMGVGWGDNLPGIALVVLVFTLTSTALGLALATVVRTSAQASSISMLMSLTLAPLGGAWWPLEIVPDFMKAVGHISPIAWAMDSFQEMMFHNGGLVDILPMLGVLLAMGAVFFGFGVWNFEYE
jgi:ABC-2 type transport system permease protein